MRSPDRNGKFEIKGLPPAITPSRSSMKKLASKTQKVTLAAKDSKTVDATFKP